MLRHIPSATFREGRWLNGMGVSWDIACDPPEAGISDFGWRFAIARIDADVPFSKYNAVDRVFTLIEGNGLTLDFAGAAPIAVDKLYQPKAFPGDVPTGCRLTDGPCRALNLFAARGVWRPSATVVTGAGRLQHEGPLLLFALNGTVQVDGIRLATGDAAVCHGAATYDAGPHQFYVARLQTAG